MGDDGPLHPSTVFRIGQGFGCYIRERARGRAFVVIGRDTRPSGENLLANLAAGLNDQGIDIIDLGIIPTPGVAYLTRRLSADLGVIVSASHSPIAYNGFKLVGSNGLRLQREEEIEIESWIHKCLASPMESVSPLGQQSNGDHLIKIYIEDHIQEHLAHCRNSLKDLKLVLDCANGAATRVAPETFKRLEAQVVVVNDIISGASINYRSGSEHARDNPQDLVQTVRGYGAAYGFAFDGDGDRLTVVDADGQVYDGHDLLFVLARSFYAGGHLRGNTVVTNHLANRGLEEALNSLGIQVVYTGNGDRNLEAAMWEKDYLLGGEPGGNIIINDGHHTAADAVFAALVLGNALACSPGVGLDQLVVPLKKRPQVTRSLKLRAGLTPQQYKILDQETENLRARLDQGGRILAWNATTEPGFVRVMVEGGPHSTPAEVLEIAGLVGEVIRQVAGLVD